MLTKQRLHEIVDHLPETFTYNEFIDAIAQEYRLRIALGQTDPDDFQTAEELEAQVDDWKLRLSKYS